MYGIRLFPLFAKLVGTVDSGPAESTDWNGRTFVMKSTDSESEVEVPGTCTPPLQRKRGRKYASLRKYETDVEDYFSDSSAEEDWIDESRYWWKKCST